ncbi:hypothetical protein FRC00_000576 [Tulasnella sp. 408]|nr:hypothetical protein FRC00_000576 [Tulasnella sp. 408]
MSAKSADFSTLSSVSQSLLKSIELENALPTGLLSNLQALSESSQDFAQDEVRASICQTVDELKKILLENVVAAQRSRNDLLLIQRLPPEVLSTIIAHELAGIEKYNYQQRLIQLSTVSSWWRSVTLGNPSLWGVIDSNNPDWITSLALERSKDAPLTVVYENDSHTTTLRGGCSCQHSTIGPEDLFELVSPHTSRWRSASLRRLGYGDKSSQWLGQHKIQLSRHLRELDLCWNDSPSTETPITGFSGLAESLLELTLRNLHVSLADIIRILSSSRRMTSLNLESLLVSEQENEATADSNLSENCPSSIALPRLAKLSLRWLPPSLLVPVVQAINVSTLETVHISHEFAEEGNVEPPYPFASFIARLMARTQWVTIDLQSTNITLQPREKNTCEYAVEFRGRYSVILPWLRLRSMPQITEEYSTELKISSEGLGDNPSQVILDNIMRFPEVRSVALEGSVESWRWMWLLSLPDAVRKDSRDPGKAANSWLWPGLRHITCHGDSVNEFTILSVLLARYGPPSKEGSMTKKDGLPYRLERLEVRPGNNEWRAEVLDRIREIVGPGRFHWDTS